MAKKEKRDVLIPYKFLPIFETLIKQDKGTSAAELVVAIISYDQYNEEPTFNDVSVMLVWESVIKPQLDENKQKYAEVSKVRSEAINNRWKQTDTKDTNEYKSNNSIQMNTKDTDYDIDIDYDVDTDIDNKREVLQEEKTPKKYQPVLEEWNKLPVTSIRIIAGKRLKLLQARIKQYSFEDVLTAIQTINKCPFLLGDNNSKWQITFDWFVSPSNFTKVLEGNYLPKEEPKEDRFDKAINQEQKDDGILFMDIVKAYKQAKEQGETRTLQEYAEEYRQRKRGEMNGISTSA